VTSDAKLKIEPEGFFADPQWSIWLGDVLCFRGTWIEFLETGGASSGIVIKKSDERYSLEVAYPAEWEMIAMVISGFILGNLLSPRETPS
jgi:hypothetical protein